MVLVIIQASMLSLNSFHPKPNPRLTPQSCGIHNKGIHNDGLTLTSSPNFGAGRLK